MPERQRREKGSGAVFQRGDGVWVGAVTLPPHPDGRRRRKQVTGHSKLEVERKVKDLKRQVLREGDIRMSSPTVTAFLTEWIDARELSGKLRPRTADTYRGYLSRHIAPNIGRVRIDKLTPAQIERMTATMVSAGCSPTTALQAHNIMKGALGAAMNRGLVDRNVAKLAEAPPVAHHEAEVLPLNEARQLLNWAATQDPIPPRASAWRS